MMSSSDRADTGNGVVAWVRLASAILGGAMLAWLTRQLLRGEIRMSEGEIDPRAVVLTTPGELLVGYLLWAPLFLALLIFGIKPGLFRTHKKLAPILFGVMFVDYIILALIT